MTKKEYKLDGVDGTGRHDVWRWWSVDNTTAAEKNVVQMPSNSRTRMPQILANVTANLLMLDLCMAIGFTTVLIGATLNASEDLSIDENDASWLGSIAFICQPIGSVLSGMIVEFFGRKWSMIIVNLPFLVGWILYSTSSSVTMLYVTNVILGVGIGFMEAPIMTYTAETCQPELRHILTSIPGVMIHVSFFVIYLLGNITDWRTAAGISTVIPIMTALYVTQMPETPIWLLSRGRYKDAENALCWLRGWVTPEVVKEEFMQLVEYNNNTNIIIKSKTTQLKQESSQGSSSKSVSDKRSYTNKGFENDDSTIQENQQNPVTLVETDDSVQTHSCIDQWKEILKPPTFRPLCLVIPYFFLLQLGGMSSVRPFMVHVFQNLGLDKAASWATVGSAVVGIAGSGCEVLTVHWLGKRFLTLVSLLGCAVSCLLIGIYSYVVLRPGGASEYAEPWIPLGFFIILTFFNSLMFQIPWMLLSEVFPFRTRAIASGLSAAICYLFLFLASMTYLPLEESLELHGVFWLFCGVNFIGFLLLFWKMPVTEGKTLAEIEQYFTGQTSQSLCFRQ